MVIVSENESESDKYEAPCDKLDALVMESFDLQKELLEKRKAMELVMKSAFFNMAQAKYLLGCTRMSMLQINTSNMEAGLKSSVEDVNSKKLTFQYDFNSFELVKTDVKDSIVTKKEKSNNSIRKRKENETRDDIADDTKEDTPDDTKEDTPDDTKEDTPDDTKDDIPDDTKDVKKEISKNPLNWFGVLVPECLRDCQKLFQQATELSLEIATLQSKINQVNKMYKSERSLKKSLNDV